MEFAARLKVSPVTLKEQRDIVLNPGGCEKGWVCKPREGCPSFKEEQAKLDSLTSFSTEWFELLSELKGLECEGEKNGICCKAEGKLCDLAGTK